MSLARRLAKQDKRDKARATLTEIHAGLPLGFDSADLKGAKALLHQVSA
jgi:hypothetical protein